MILIKNSARSLMRVQLMRADRIIVDIRRVLQVFPAKSLHPVRMEQRLRISGFYKRRNPFYVVFRPGLIVYVHNADKRGIFVHRPRDRFRRCLLYTSKARS